MAEPTPPLLLNLSPTALVKTLLGLRGVALMAFPFATFLAAALERGPLILVVFAAAMLGIGEVERRRAHKLSSETPPGWPPGLIAGFALRLGLLAGLFIVLLGVMTLFRDTSLARGLGWTDLALVGFASFVALVANEVSARLALARADKAIQALRHAMNPEASAPGGATAGGEIIEGEVIPPEPPAGAKG